MELLERDTPLETSNELFKRVCAGEGEILLVSGEAGIGKTAFVTQFAAFQRAARILWGASDPLFTPRPLGPLYDIALGGLPQLLDLLNSGVNWFAAAAELQKSLMASSLPVILVLEDIHWADEATLDLIKYLGRRIHQMKVLLVLTYREDEIGSKHPLRSVLGDLPARHTTRLRLERLSPAAVDQIARQLNHSVEGIYQITGGNPFFVTEALRSPGNQIPATIRDMVLSRAAHLDTPARDLLELAAIIPGPAEMWLLEAILHPDPAAVDACVASGLLISGRETLAFRHELARRAIEESLSPAHAKMFHQIALQALNEPSAPPVSLARLFHHAAHAQDAAAVLEFGPRASQQASRHGAHREAARYLRAVLPYRHLLSIADQARLLDSLSFEDYLTGQIKPAIDLRQEAVDLWQQAKSPLRVGDDQRWLSRLYWFYGNREMADHFAREAVDTLEPLPQSKELAMAYSNQSQLYMLAEERQPAVAWGEKALALAEKFGETEIIVHALTNIGTSEMLKGEQAGYDRLERALRLAQQFEMHDHAARCFANLISLFIQNRVYSLADRYLSEGLAYIRDRDMDSYGIYLLGWQARYLFEQGRWAEASGIAEEMLRQQPGSPVMALPGITTLGHLQARQGISNAAHWLDQARDLALPTNEIQRVGPLAIARAEAAWWSGRKQQVLEELKPLASFSGEAKDRYLRGAEAYWIWQAGGEFQHDLEILPVYRAMIAGDWRAAADEWARIGNPFEQALALSAGDVQAKRSALAIFEKLGAQPAARKLREEMAKEGVKRLPRGARRSTRANPEGLTAREMEILPMLEEGLSNAEIARRLSISPKTVDHHVSAILAKLGAHSRVEAASLARRKHIIK